jgi:hypothetical protein
MKTKLEKQIEELNAVSKEAVEDLYGLLEAVVEENKELKKKLVNEPVVTVSV